MKNKFANYFDFIFKILIIFVIALIWFRSYYHNNTQILSYTFLTTVGFGIIFAFISQKKEKKIKTTKFETTQINLMKNTLTFNTDKENFELLKHVLNGYETKIYNNYLKINSNMGIVINYDDGILTENSILKIYKQFKNNGLIKLFICCNNFDKKAFDLTNKIKDFEMILLNNESTYFSIFKKNNYIFKNGSKIKTSKKSKFKNYLYIAFNRKKTKSYLFAGIILLLGTIFMRYNIYYLIWTSIMLFFALFSFFNKPFNPKISDNIFEKVN